ncbi:MAG: VWA domain-containing protein, partial [Deltaproteobacteria bacterium]|nr:VWA domain-containing protein [Deltaproteobacteria bacterium]
LFIRLKRDERDITALFLVDMSNSTRGWVGKAIKESLVLICEAMETLGDRYGIYGFSGMRRLRCEIFPIKNIDQSYNNKVRERIGSIAPREYTRMAPAIRHMTSILKDVDAKVRLLITLSDGKPEDYDEYKGEYAIEDTRHALIETKMAGIHPFCITIDQHAHEYMAHMYGEVNYIFINDVSKLPARMPEIYRVLTS